MNDTAILVISCDKYRDLWRPFFTIFRYRWPDCPYPIFLGTNHRRYEDDAITTVTVGDDQSWASGVRKMLDAVASESVITFLEDFFIEKPVDTARIVHLVEIARNERLGCLRLAAGLPLAFPPSRPVPQYPGIGVLDPGEIYRVSAQVAIWRKETLEKFLVPGANPWEFEVVGSALSHGHPDPFWAVYEPAIVYDQVVEKGKWKPNGIRLCQELGVSVDLEAREAFSDDELAIHFERSFVGVPEYRDKMAIVRAFRSGRRTDGLRLVSKALFRRPMTLRLWAIALAGVVGPRVFTWLEILDARLRAMRIRRRATRRREVAEGRI